jgi:hypothetical protein
VTDLEALLQSLGSRRAAWIAAAATVIVYILVLLAIPVVLARLPADHFVRPPRPRHPVVRAIRAGLGGLLLLAGISMLFLPGPGVLSIVIGLSLMGGPLAARFTRRLLLRPRVLGAVNAIRARRGRPPLVPPPAAPHDSA